MRRNLPVGRYEEIFSHNGTREYKREKKNEFISREFTGREFVEGFNRYPVLSMRYSIFKITKLDYYVSVSLSIKLYKAFQPKCVVEVILI